MSTSKLVSMIPPEFWDHMKPEPYDPVARAAESERQVREAFSRNRLAAARNAAHKLGVSPEAVEAMSGGSYKPTKAIEMVKNLITSPSKTGLILAGNVGTGKTFAAAYAWLHRKPDQYAEFMKAPDLRAAVTPWRGDPEAIDLGTWLVIVDDLGTEKTDEHWNTAFQKLVDARVGQVKTIITTNLTPAQMRARYNPRTIDRLRAFDFAGLSGESMRPSSETSRL